MRKTMLIILLNLMLLSLFSQDHHFELYQEAIQHVKDDQCEVAVEKFGVIIKESENKKLLKMTYIFNSQCLRKLGQLNESLASIDKAIEIDPEDVASYFDKIHVLEELEDYNQIIKECNDILKKKPEQEIKSDCYYYLGKSNLGLGQFSEAIKHFNSGIKYNNADYLQYFYRAFAYEQKGITKKALDNYTKALELYPEFGQAYASRGILKINEIINEYEGIYVNILGKEACADLQKAKELGIDVQEMIDLYCN